MKLFNRKPKATNIPAELEPYYSKTPTWRVVVRRIFAVILILAVIVALVWAVRAVYRQVTNDGDEHKTTETSQQQDDDTQRDKATDASSDNESNGAREQTNDADTATGANGNATSGEANSTAGDGETMPRTGDDPTDVPPQSVLPATGG